MKMSVTAINLYLNITIFYLLLYSCIHFILHIAKYFFYLQLQQKKKKIYETNEEETKSRGIIQIKDLSFACLLLDLFYSHIFIVTKCFTYILLFI